MSLECAVQGCSRLSYARGWCQPHYNRWRRNGDPLAGRAVPRMEHPDYCEVSGCPKPYEANGMCATHYNRVRRHGSAADRSRRRYPPDALCAVAGCGKQRQSREWCDKHYMRWYSTGDPGEAADRWVRGSEGPYDKEGYVLWHRKQPDGTRRIVYEHQEVMEAHLGRRLRKG